MPRTMYDSTNPAAIPTTAELVGGYTDGIYGPAFKALGRSSVGWDAAAWARFPNSVHVPISAIGTDTGTVGDVEPGCMTPVQGVHWVQMRRQAGVDPTIYCNQTYGWGPVRQAFKAAGVAEPHYWVANYDRVIVIPAGAIAKQYANPTLSGGAYDLSVVADFWPGVDNGGGGSVKPTVQRRRYAVATTKSLHQFCRGGNNQLFHRRRVAGTWSPWVGLGGRLGPDAIVPSVDDQGTIIVTVTGGTSDGSASNGLFYDYVSTDDGLTFTGPTANAAGGDQMTALAVLDASSTTGGGWTATQEQKLDGIVTSITAIRQRVEKDLAP